MTTPSFSQAVGAAPVVLIEFYASWCPHCQRMMPVVEQVKKELEPEVPVFQYDIDHYPKESDEAKIETIPTFIIYADGKPVWRHSGEMTADDLIAKVRSYTKG